MGQCNSSFYISPALRSINHREAMIKPLATCSAHKHTLHTYIAHSVEKNPTVIFLQQRVYCILV